MSKPTAEMVFTKKEHNTILAYHRSNLIIDTLWGVHKGRSKSQNQWDITADFTISTTLYGMIGSHWIRFPSHYLYKLSAVHEFFSFFVTR